MRQIRYSSFILSRTFLTLFLLKNIFTWYEWLGMHAAFQPCFLRWKFFLPPAPHCLVLPYSYPFLKLSSFSLADSTKNTAGWYKIPRTSMQDLQLPPWGRSPTFLPAAGRRLGLHGCVRPSGGGGGRRPLMVGHSPAASVLPRVFGHPQDYFWPKWWTSISLGPGLPRVSTSWLRRSYAKWHWQELWCRIGPAGTSFWAEPQRQTCHRLAGFLLCSYDTKSEIFMSQFNWGGLNT